MRKIFTLVFAALLIISCKDTKNSKVLGDQNAGKTLTGWYFYHLMEGNYDSIPKLLDQDAFAGASATNLVNTLKERQQINGTIKKFNLEDWETTDQNKKEKTKDFYFEYDVTYQNKTSKEKIYLSKKGKDLKISKIEFDVAN